MDKIIKQEKFIVLSDLLEQHFFVGIDENEKFPCPSYTFRADDNAKRFKTFDEAYELVYKYKDVLATRYPVEVEITVVIKS